MPYCLLTMAYALWPIALPMSTAFIFPGQGSQVVGMGKALAGAFTEAKEVFAEVDDALNQKLSQLMFEGPESDLTLTANAQPAIMASSMALFRVLQKQTGLKISDAAFVAGHSLGEYSALCAAETFSLAETARLLRIRGEAMQAAVPPGIGAMAAIIGLEKDAVSALAAEAAQGETCVLANDNSPGQLVISGHASAIARACELAKAKGAKRALPLNVSAPFHSPLMEPAASRMKEALAASPLQDPKAILIANVTARPAEKANEIRELLVKQVTGSVRWTESVQTLALLGVTRTLEIGTGKVLTGLVKRIAPDLATLSISEPADVDAFATA
jgi:[acyl-carrier-protein] S-malonyltransferase